MENVIFVYPVNMSDYAIRHDITMNDGANAIISHATTTETDVTFQDGRERRGFKFTLEDDIRVETRYLDGTAETTILSEGQSSYTYRFKIAFGVRPNVEVNEGIVQSIEYFQQFVQHDLKMEIETGANLIDGSRAWRNKNYATIMLRNVRIDPHSLIFNEMELYEPEEIIVEYSEIELRLIGEEVINIFLDTTYIDQGVILERNGVDITSISNIETIGIVDTSVLGEHIITFSYMSEETGEVYTVSRTVIVTNVNSPGANLMGLIPVKYNNGNWVTAPTNNVGLSWYEYRTQSETTNGTIRWAHAKDVDGDIFVWIPRFAYNDENSPLIYIRFLEGISNIAADEEDWTVHPVFTYGPMEDDTFEELEGIWIPIYVHQNNMSNFTIIYFH